MPSRELTNQTNLDVEKIRLKRSINFWAATAILVTNIGGSAAFISPPAVLQYAGSPMLALIVWLISGILNGALAFCFLEVALFLPCAGGAYFYIMEVLGPFCGFIFLWGFVILIIGPSWSINAYSAVLYILSAIVPDCVFPDIAVKLIAVCILLLFIALNCTYVKFVTKVQGILSGAKILALLIIIVVGFTQFKGTENYLSEITRVDSIDPGGIALAFFSGFYNYGGWPIVTILIEEVKNPTKTLTRSMMLSITLVTVLFVLVNFTYCILLTPREIIKSDAVAVVAMQHIHPALGFTISILVALCSIGGLNVLILGQPRILFAASRVGHMPKLFQMISCKYLTPWPAIIGCSIPVMCVLLSGSIVSFIDFMSLFASIMISTVLVCSLYLRYKFPDAPRPLKMPIVLPILMLILILILIAMSVYRKPKELGICLLYLIMGIPVYLLGVVWEKPKKFYILQENVTYFIKRLLILEKSHS
ncbi:hypothetical protein LOTGIDRAFT_232209 [Lottia gigantea]|uniref:Cationic amino acid transporter C-terminal domain-containing protein n=1 Tax=Lottia gigantea TaxID=225164 RepID=V4AK58_LOTGI|nr:hypothetical protein LOTGIDRAFT_232209 [Lottia gigantea]ESO95120.1 hypothetical protein LOTGIDRAFT_232209 [Lottia gigantea]